MQQLETFALTQHNAKIRVIREQILAEEVEIRDLETKKHQMWIEIKDFGSADAVKADRGYAYMSKLHRQIVKLQNAIAAGNKKIRKIEEDDLR